MDEQKILDLIEELRDLTRTLRSSIGGGPDTAKLIAALGVLSAKMDGTARNRKEEIRAANDFAKSVTIAASRQQKQAAALDKNTQATEANTRAKQKSLAEEINERRRLASSSREAYEAARNLGGGMSQLHHSFLDLGKGSLAAQAGLQGISAVAGGAAKALLGYSAAIQNGERGAKVSGKALEQFATPILDTISTLGTLAMVLPGVGKWFGKGAGAAANVTGKFLKLGGATAVVSAEIGKFGVKFVQAGLTQADKLFDSFQKLSQVGIAGAGGIDDVFGMLQELGLSTGEIEKFNTLIAANAQTIKFLGATAADGANELAKVAGGLYKSKLGRQLELMGVTQAEMNELTLINMSNEAKAGQLRKKTDLELQQSTAKFVKELDMAAQLTGASRKELAEAQAAANADERFRAALVDARNRNDEQELQRLQKAQALAAIVKKSGDEKGATGILQLAASGGAMTTEAATAAQQTYGVNEIISSQGTVMDAVEKLVANGRISQSQMAGINKYIGTISGIQTGVVGQADLLDRLGPALDAIQKENITLEEYFKRQQTDRQEPKPGDTTLMVDAARMQQNAAMIQDQSLKQLSSAATIHSTATMAFEAAVKKFGEVVGTMPKSQIVTGGAETEAAKKAAFEAKQYAEARKKAEDIGKMSLFTPTEADIERVTQALLAKMPKYAAGGIASGPTGGHLALLHGTEAVIPLAGGSIPVSLTGGQPAAGEVGSGPAFSKANAFAAQMDKVIKALDDSNKYLSDIYDEIKGGATVGGAGGSAAAMTAAMNAHDRGHQHEAPTITPEAAQQLGKGLGSPLEDLKVTSGFGMRIDPITGKQAGHGGVDLAGVTGAAIKAPEAGTARVVGEAASGGYGNMVEILDSQGKVMHRMAHMSETMVKTGDKIEAGMQIGKVGSTGRSTGSHLHWEKFDPTSGMQVDPMAWLAQQQGKTPGFGTTGGGAATGNPQAARRGQRYGATQYGSPTDMATYMKTVAMLESGGDPNAKAGTSNGNYSSAGGLFQFLESSYEGVTGRKGSGAERFDPQKATEAMQKLTMMNKSQMEKGLGREVSGEDLYMGHFLGAGGATKFLKQKDQNPNALAAEMMPTEAASNKSIYYKDKEATQSRTMAEVHELMTEKYRKQQAAIQAGQKLPDVVAALGTGGMQLAAPTAAAPTATAGVVGQPPTGFAPGQAPQAAAQPTTLAGIFGSLLGITPTSTSGLAGPTMPGAGGDMTGITAALQAQTAATQTAITSSMETMTTRLVESLGATGGIAGGDSTVPTLLGEIVTAQREQTSAINRLIQVQTA